MRVLKTSVLVLVLVSLQGGLFGCGSSSETAAPTVSKMRTLQVGDSWTYDISRQTASASSTGTLNMSITQDTIAGVSVLAETSTIDLATNGSNTIDSTVGYVQQDTITGDVYPYAVKNSITNDQVITVTDRPLPIVWPGSWEAGKTVTSTIHYSNGTSETASYTINGQESVATPAGVKTAWKVTLSGSTNAGTASGIIWFSTELGNYVRMDVTTTAGTASYILRSTTVK